MGLLRIVFNLNVHSFKANQFKATLELFRLGMILLTAFCAGVASAANLQVISTVDGTPSASANGDSGNPIVSRSGRYVLFSSSANNLVLTNGAGPIPSLKPPRQNVFLRDRDSGSNFLVSVSLSGDGGNSHSWPVSISTNGQYVLFESSASDLVSGDTNNANDVFVRDMVNGITTLVSVNTNGTSGNGPSRSSAMTPDGRYVVFVSQATDLGPDDTNGIPDIFVRDMQAHTTTLVSPGAVSTGSIYLPSSSESPAITPDGRYVAFYSTATNLVSGNQLAGEVYVRDLVDDVTTWASTNGRSLFQSVFATNSAISCGPAISDDGRWVAFLVCNSAASSKGLVLSYDAMTQNTSMVYTNAFVPTWVSLADIKTFDQSFDGRFIAFIANDPVKSNLTDIYLHDGLLETNMLVSADKDTGLTMAAHYGAPVVDATGRHVTFYGALATNLVSTPVLAGTDWHLYMRDIQLGSTKLIDVDTNGYGAGIGPGFSVSADANTVAFDVGTSGFVLDDRNGDYDVVARDLTMATTELVSARHALLPATTPDRYSRIYSTSLSTNARFIAFVSDADNLVTNDFNNCGDVFVRDTLLGKNFLASVATNGTSAANMSTEPSISGDGRFVAYSSFATNIVSGDTNKSWDVFVYDLQNGTNFLVSTATNGGFGNSNSYSPQISLDGRYVLFRSQSQNLATGPFAPGSENLFLRDLLQMTNFALTTGSVVNASMTLDGHYVAFIGVTGGSALTNLYVWDTLAASLIYTDTSGAFSNVCISGDGRWVAYVSGPALYAQDIVGNSNYLVATASFDFRAGLQFSADDQSLAFVTKTSLIAADVNSAYDIYLHDFQNGTNLLVSRSFDDTYAANKASTSPSLSPDGRFVAYRSDATDLVPNATNTTSDLYVYDRVTGATLLITVNQTGNSTANYTSRMPVFSGDSKSLVFTSCASDLPDSGFNEYNAIYAFNLSPPTIVDTDGDGMDDQWEMDYFGTLSRDGTGDFDGDGMSDLAEFLAGTDPTNPASVLKGNISLGAATGQIPVITWPLSSGKFYRVQFKDDLSDPSWQDLDGNTTLVGTHGQAFDLAPSLNHRFYRIVLSY